MLKKRILCWETTHAYNNQETKISLNWENEESNKRWVKIDNYTKLMRFEPAQLFRYILKHLLMEKIKHAESYMNKENDVAIVRERVNLEPEKVNKAKNENKEKGTLKGFVKGETQKALLINFEEGEYWIPKSKIPSQFNSEKDAVQDFLIDSWILKKIR